MKADHLSAGAVPFRLSKDQPEFLILRAFKYWDFPKGMVEAEEDPWDAALREVEEETGLTNFKRPAGKKFYETEAYGKGKVARYYLLECVGECNVILIPNPVTGIVEHHEFRWVTYDEGLELLVPRVQKALKWAQSHIKK